MEGGEDNEPIYERSVPEADVEPVPMEIDGEPRAEDPPLADPANTEAAANPSPTPEARSVVAAEEASLPSRGTMPADAVSAPEPTAEVPLTTEPVQATSAPEIVVLPSPELPEPAAEVAAGYAPSSSISVASTSAPGDDVPAGILLSFIALLVSPLSLVC